ncbi:MAG: alginate export family protein [Alphaproteobacteria bacterium]|nr:alginate export family protein [Alphaproteobacteria bacterium]
MLGNPDSSLRWRGPVRNLFIAATALGAAALGPNFAAAEMKVFQEGGLTLNLGIEAGTYYVRGESVNFGTGQVDLRNGNVRSDTVDSFEAFVKPSISASYDNSAVGTIYGGAAFVGTLTRGDGDPGGFTVGEEEDVDLERLFVGWRSGNLLKSSGKDAIDVSFGRQEFQIGDGFLIKDGNLDQFDKAAFWLAPRNAFEQAALVRINTKPVRGDAFYLMSDGDQDDTRLAGGNVEYVHETYGTLGGSYFHIIDADDVNYTRKGMNVVSVRGQGKPVAAVPDLSLAGEFVHESGGADGADIDAHAWYLEAGYTFSKLPWSPKIAYRFSRFTGDDPSTSDIETFDPLFYGYSRGWGTWYQGEIAGEYLLFNSNQQTHMVHLSATPTDSFGVGAIYYKFLLDENSYFGTPVASRDFADELNVYVDWYGLDYLSLGALYAVTFPASGATEAFGGDEPFQVFQLYANIKF